MYYEDRLKGGGLLARHPGRRGRGRFAAVRRDRRAAPQPAGASDHAGRARRSAHRGGAHRPHHRGAGAARHADAAGRPAAARSRRGAGVIRTNLSTRPFYNERSRPPLARGDRAGGARGHRVQRLPGAALLAQRHPPGDAGLARRSTGRRSAPQAARLRAQRRPEAGGLRRRRRPTGQRADRSAHLLVDRALQPLRDHAARRGAHRVGAAARRSRPRHRPRDQRHRPQRRRRQHVHREPREHRRVHEHPAGRRADRRSRHAAVEPRGGVSADDREAGASAEERR